MTLSAIPIFIFVSTLVACPYTPKPLPPEHGNVCIEAQKKLESLRCEQAHTKKGHAYQEVCLDAATQGLDLKPQCVASIHKCKDVEACH